jgi:hypothetical protein
MKTYTIFVCFSFAAVLAISPADAQIFTTRRIGVTGTASIRIVTAANDSESDTRLPDGQADVEALHRSGAAGPGPAVGATSAAIAAPNPELALSFDGLRMIDSLLADGGQTLAVEPPDQGLCAGNGFVLESVNSAIRVYDTNGNALSGVTSLHTFYGYPFANSAAGLGPQISDPVCYYDPDTRRWFHVIATSDRVGTTSALAGPNHIDLAVSQTPSPLGLWNIYKIPTQNDGTEGTPDHHCEGGPCFGDFPKIGADANGIYITENESPFFFVGAYRAQIYALSKRALTAGVEPVTVVQFDTSASDLLLDGSAGFTVWPATAPASAYATDLGGTEYFLSATNATAPGESGPGKSLQPVPSSDHRLRIWALSNTQSLNTANPALVVRHGVIDVLTYSLPPVASQKEGSVPLADCLNDSTLDTPLGTGCWRYAFSKKPSGNERESQRVNSSLSGGMLQVVYAVGKLWGSMNTALDLGHGIQAGVAYFVLRPQISTGGLSGQVVKQGYLGLANHHLLHPSVGVTANGRGVLTFSLLGDDHFPSAAYATLDATAGVGNIHIAAEGLGPDDGFTAYKAFEGQTPITRWGDYSATAVDGNSIWIGSEYIGQTCTFADFVSAPIGRCGETRTALGNWYTRISKITP